MIDDAAYASMYEYYSDALDEIYRLRAALAFESTAVSDYLTYRTLPKRCRATASAQVVRMRQAAGGDTAGAYHINNYQVLQDAGMPATLTRHAWENR